MDVAIRHAADAFGDCPFRQIADTYDTPTHVLDLQRLRSNGRDFAEVFAAHLRLCTPLYSVKTNYLPLVLRELKSLGYGVDVVSGPELELAYRLGFNSHQIVFNGPHKTDAELEEAVQRGILINIDSLDEAGKINSLAQSGRVDVGLRVNPGLSVYTSADPTFLSRSARSAEHSKFGYSIHDGEANGVLKALTRMSHIAVVALHCHLGSQITSCEPFLRAIARFLEFAKCARDHVSIGSLNIGGGFGVPGIVRRRVGPLHELLKVYGVTSLDAAPDRLDLNQLFSQIADLLDAHDLADMRIFAEPGRVIVSDAFALLTRVSAVKRSGGLDWVIVDAGLNLLPTIAMNETHCISCVRQDGAPLKPFHVGGALCYEGDIIVESCPLPQDLRAGDLLLIHDSGAYSISRATNFIRPRASVVVWDGTTAALCWRRESFADVFMFDAKTSWETRGATRIAPGQ